MFSPTIFSPQWFEKNKDDAQALIKAFGKVHKKDPVYEWKIKERIVDHLTKLKDPLRGEVFKKVENFFLQLIKTQSIWGGERKLTR